MFNSPDMSEIEMFAGRKSGKATDRSNFAQTCSLLSQYLKEKGSFGDLSLEMTGKIETKERTETFRPSATTMNLLQPKMERSGETSIQNAVASPNSKSMDFFPQFANFGSSSSVEDAGSRTDFKKTAVSEPDSAQMTIFYGGKVLVFNDFPAEKAKEMMALASKGSSNNSNGFLSTSGGDIINSGSFVASASNNNNIIPTSGINSTQERLQHQPQAIDHSADMRIVRQVGQIRRASLHRFFEKRKDRAASKAPYQVNHPSITPKPEENNSGLDLESPSSSKQLELKL